MKKHQIPQVVLSMILVISISLGSLPGTVFAAASTNKAVDPTQYLNDTFFIKNKNSGKYLDIKGGQPTNGSNLIQWTFSGNKNQQWKLKKQSNGTYKIVSVLSGSPSIDISGKSNKNGANAQIWKSSQTFKLVKVSGNNYKIESSVSGKAYKVLSVDGASKQNGANVMQWSFGQGGNDQWQFERLLQTNKSETTSQKNAVSKAKTYLKNTAFSREGLIDQLKNENFSEQDAIYGADHCGANWKEPVKKGNLMISTLRTDQPVGEVSKQFINQWDDITPDIQTIVNSDGSVSVMTAPLKGDTLSIHEFKADGSFIQTITIKRKFDLVGAFSRDEAGQYYVLYGKNVKEYAYTEHNIAVVKYNAIGTKIQTFSMPAQTTGEKWRKGSSGIQFPFSFGTAKMEISGDYIAVYFAREFFVANDGLNHQASYGFILDKNSLNRLSDIGNSAMEMPSASHSNNQYILPTSGGFLFVDHGDYWPRSFMFTKVTASGSKRLNAFTFKQGTTYQNTFAEMGGLAKTDDGYIFVGTYEKNDNIRADHNDSRNLFIMTMDENLQAITSPIWITDYTDLDHDNVIFPKIAQIEKNKYLLMWNLVDRDNLDSEEPRVNSNTYFTIIDNNGKILRPVSMLKDTPLNGFDTLRYNPTSKLVHWATEQGDQSVVLYSFDPNK